MAYLILWFMWSRAGGASNVTTSSTPAIELEQPLGPSSWLGSRSVGSIGTQTLTTHDIQCSDDVATTNTVVRPLIFFPPSRDREQVLTLVSPLPPLQGDSTYNVSPNQTNMARRGGQLENWLPLQRPIAILPPPPNAPKTTPSSPLSRITKLGMIDLT